MQTEIEKAARISTRYRIACITNSYETSLCTDEWRSLVAKSTSCEKIYQSPEFFRFLVKSRHCKSDRFELFTVSDDQDRILGILPLRWSSINLDFRIGSFVFYSYRVSVIRLLGSLPMLGEPRAFRNEVMNGLLDRFPDRAAILMQSFPIEEKDNLQPNSRVKFSVIHGWRICHTIPVPDQFDSYLQKFSAKKRYNMAREIRLLKRELGTMCLTRIEHPSDVPELFDCLNALNPWPGDRSVNKDEYTIFAENNISLSYSLRANGEFIAAVLGSRYGDTWHVHRIYFAQKYRHLSPGSVTMHLAIEDVMRHFSFAQIDFGFGTPTYKWASTHALKKRATVLVSRRKNRVNFIFSLFVLYDEFHSRLAKLVITAAKVIGAKARRLSTIRQ